MKISWIESSQGRYVGFGTVKYKVTPCYKDTGFACKCGLDRTIFIDSFKLAVQECQKYENEISK